MISTRTKRSVFLKLERALAQANADIDAEEARTSEDFLSPEDEDFRHLASCIGEILDRFWHLRGEGG